MNWLRARAPMTQPSDSKSLDVIRLELIHKNVGLGGRKDVVEV